MKKINIRKGLFSVFAIAVMSVSFLSVSGGQASAATGDVCDVPQGTLLGIPPWYKYLNGKEVEQRNIDGSTASGICQPDISIKGTDKTLPITDILAIVAAILEILVRIAGLAAFIYLIYGGFMYLTSGGNAEQVKNAGSTLLNAAIGLAIAISATTIINFFAGKLAG